MEVRADANPVPVGTGLVIG